MDTDIILDTIDQIEYYNKNNPEKIEDYFNKLVPKLQDEIITYYSEKMLGLTPEIELKNKIQETYPIFIDPNLSAKDNHWILERIKDQNTYTHNFKELPINQQEEIIKIYGNQLITKIQNTIPHEDIITAIQTKRNLNQIKEIIKDTKLRSLN